MLKKNKENEQGFTFVEILTCLAIVALIVGPICFSFLSSLKTRVTAESINEATDHAESLLEDIKVQITNDIILRQKIVGNRVPTVSYSSDDKFGVGNYLTDLPIGVTSRAKVEMSAFLKGTDALILNGRYDTDKYAYEVALWRMADIPLTSSGTEESLTLDVATIDQATKLYTDSSSDYQFDPSKYVGIANPITFSLSEEMLKAFKDSELTYVPNQTVAEAEYKILDKNTIILNDANTPTIENKRDKAGNTPAIQISDIKPIKDSSDDTQGYVFTIAEGTIDSSEFPKASTDKSYYRSIIELDVRNVLRNTTDLSNNTVCDDLTYKFVNTTGYDQLIYIRQNAINDGEAATVVKKFNVVATNTGTGKSNIIRVDDIIPYENYLIAIIVREKNPALGEQGKIVKKMIDIFSYDVTTDQRR